MMSVVDYIRQQIRDTGARTLKQICKRFGAYDADQNRAISVDEFKSCLEDYGIQLSDGEYSEVFRAFDTNRNGTLDLNEFITAIRPPMNNMRRHLVKMAFEKFDRNGDGVVTVDDIIGTYDVTKHPKYQSGEWTKRKVLQEFLDQFQVAGDSRDETVTLEEFMDYYSVISAHVDRDIYFDFMMRNSWKL